MEDGDVVATALAIAPGEMVVSVASAGDNVFQLALSPARHVFGVDISANQIAFCRLKESAIAQLEHDSWLAFMGMRAADTESRQSLLKSLPLEIASTLQESDSMHVRYIQSGLVHCGQLSEFLEQLRQGFHQVLPVDSFAEILNESKKSIRTRLWDQHFESPHVLDFLAQALNRETISQAFIPPHAFDRLAEPEFSIHYHKVLRHLLVDHDPSSNYFLHRMWLGRFPTTGQLPTYARAENYAALGERLPSISWHTCDLTHFLGSMPDNSVHAFNLSNILDWCTAPEYEGLWLEVDRVSSSNARVFLRSFLAEDLPPQSVLSNWSIDQAQSDQMSLADRVGYFSRYELWSRNAQQHPSGKSAAK